MKNFTIFCMLCIIIVSCKKDAKIETTTTQINSQNLPNNLPPKPIKKINIPDSIKSYSFFKIGTYWVYKDSIDGSIDSTYVTSIDTSYTLVVTNVDSNYLYENYKIYLSSNFRYSYFSVLADNPNDVISNMYGIPDNHPFSVFSINNKTQAGSGCCDSYPVNNLLVSGISYFGIRYFYGYFNFTVPSGGYTAGGQFYWKKGIGVLKYLDILKSGKHFRELIRYQVVQ